MKKYGTALWDKYLPAAIFCLLWACCAQAQTLQPVSAWGYKWNRGLFTTAFGIPKDTAVLNAEQKQFPHIAYKGENRYRWSVQQQKWVDDGASGSPVDSMAFRKDSVFIFNSDTVYYVGSIDTLYIHSIIENYTRDSVFTYHDSLIIQRDSIFIYNTTRDTTYFIGEVDPSLSNKVDSVTFGTSPYVDTVKYWVNGTATIAGYINKPQGCVDSDGGIVVYRESTLIADISPKPFYCINGEQYSFTGGTVTHDAADATYPRYDWVVLNTSGGVEILKGIAAESPSPGVVDETLYKPLTFILIVPTGTTPADLDPELPYDENTGEPDEWTTSTTIPGANFNATAQVFSGTKSTTLLGWANGQYLKYLNDADVARSRFTSFSFRLWLTANMSKQQNISVQFWKDNTAVSNLVPAIINKTTLNAYQLVAFDMGQFTFSQQEFDEARLTFSGSSASTIYIDRVEFQGLPGGSGGGSTSQPLVITDGTRNETVNTPLKFRGDGKVTFTVGSNTTHGDFVLGQINVDSLTGQPITNITGLQDALDARVIDVKWYTGVERDTMVVEFANGEQLRYVTPVIRYNAAQFEVIRMEGGDSVNYIGPTGGGGGLDSIDITQPSDTSVVFNQKQGGSSIRIDTIRFHVTNPVSSLTLSTPNVLYNTPVTFNNTAGAWSGALSLKTQTANTVLAGPTTGSAATPTFRSLVAADIPNLPASKITSGTFDAARLASGTPLTNYVPAYQADGSVLWQAQTGSGGSSQWITSGNHIYYPSGAGYNVGIGSSSALGARLTVTSDGLGQTGYQWNSGINIRNSATVNSTTTWHYSPMLTLTAPNWNPTSSASDSAMAGLAVGGDATNTRLQFFFRRYNSAVTNPIYIDNGGSVVTTGGVSLSGYITQTGTAGTNNFRSPLYLDNTTTGAIIQFNGNGNNRSVFGRKTAGDITLRVQNANSVSNGVQAIGVSNVMTNVVVGGADVIDSAAQLSVISTSKGFLPPRMTTTQRDAIGLYVASVTVTNGGSGYTSVSISATTATGEIALATTTSLSGGALTAVTVLTGGYYLAAPTLTVTGNGSGATVTPVMAQRIPEGLMIFNTTTKKIQVHDGTTWQDAW